MGSEEGAAAAGRPGPSEGREGWEWRNPPLATTAALGDGEPAGLSLRTLYVLVTRSSGEHFS